MIPIFKPYMDKKDIEAVSKVIKSYWIGQGPKTKQFEEEFAKFIGVGYAVAVNSGTAALYLALKVLNLEKGSEVLVPGLTFVATAFAAEYNDLRPVFVDIKENSLNINPEDIKKKITAKTKAIIPVHYAGLPCNILEIIDIAKKNNLYVIEDAAHACGSVLNGKRIGSFGDLACFSFHPVKNLPMGDGGMIVTNNKEYYERLLKLRWMGIESTFDRSKEGSYSWDYDIKEIGYKCHANDIMSALGLVQLKKLKKSNKMRRNIFKRYNKEFSGLPGFECPIYNDKSSCWAYVAKSNKREELIEFLQKKGISAGVHYKPLYLHTIYKDVKADCPIIDKVWKRLITLPLYPSMTAIEFNKIVKAIKLFHRVVYKDSL